MGRDEAIIRKCIQIIAVQGHRNVYFWRTQAGAELDLLTFFRGRAIGYEIKVADAPRTTKSMRIALADLGLHHLYVVYPGSKTYPLDERMTCLGAKDLVRYASVS